MSTRAVMMLGATAIVVAVAVFAITRSDAGDRNAPSPPERAHRVESPEPASLSARRTSPSTDAPPASSGKPPRPITFARPSGMNPSAPATPAATKPASDPLDPKREDMRTAYAQFAAGDYGAALVASQRVLATRPDEPSMLKIAIASACATGAADTANTLAQTVPSSLRDDAVLSCARFGIKLDFKRPVRTRQPPPRPAKT